MSLTTCPDCSHELSTLAKTCPNCGRPAGESEGAAYKVGRVIELSLLVAIIGAGLYIGLRTQSPVIGWILLILGVIAFAKRFNP